MNSKAFDARDHGTAILELRLQAEQGLSSAQYNLGRWYRYGAGDTKDYPTAIGWYRAAAEQGNALAQYDLGVMHFEGLGVARNLLTAQMWFLIAAASGVADGFGKSTRVLVSPADLADAQALADEWARGHQMDLRRISG